MNIHRVPPEIQDIIIDCLQDDKETLDYCSLVSSVWLRRARYWLLSTATITIWSGYRSHEDIGKVLNIIQPPGGSTLASQRRNICIRDIHDTVPFVHEHSTFGMYTSLSECIETVLPILTQIDSLTMRNISWFHLSKESKVVICSLFHLTTLKLSQVLFKDMDELHSLFSQSFRGLTSLDIGALFLEVNQPVEAQSQDLSLSLALPRLHDLTLRIGQDNAATIRAVTKSAFFLPENITSLYLLLHDQEFQEEFQLLLVTAGARLTKLQMSFHESIYRAAQVPYPLTLAHNVNLSSLVIIPWKPVDSWDTPYLRLPWPPECGTSILEDLFASLTSTHVDIWLHTLIYDDLEGKNLDLGSLQRSLTSNENSTRHRILHFMAARDDDVDIMEEIMKIWLPELDQRGQLVVEQSACERFVSEKNWLF